MTEIDFLSSLFDGRVVVPVRPVGLGTETASSANSCEVGVSAVGRAVVDPHGLMHAPRNVFPRHRSGDLDG